MYRANSMMLATAARLSRKETKRKNSAGSDDTASMIKGGGYLGARTRQPHTAQTNKKKLIWIRGVVCRSTQTPSLTVVACVILQCIPCFNKCRCMSGFFFPLPSGLCSVDWVRPHHSSRGCCRPLFGSHGRARFLRHSRARCSPAAAGVQKAQQLRFL